MRSPTILPPVPALAQRFVEPLLIEQQIRRQIATRIVIGQVRHPLLHPLEQQHRVS